MKPIKLIATIALALGFILQVVTLAYQWPLFTHDGAFLRSALCALNGLALVFVELVEKD